MLAWIGLPAVVGTGVAVASTTGLAILATVVAMVAAALLLSRPVILIGLALLSAVFAQTITHFAPTITALHLDEAPVALAILGLPLARIRQGKPLRGIRGRWFVAFAAIGITSAVAAGVPVGTMAAGAYAPLRGVALGWAIAQHDWTEGQVASLGRAGRRLLVALMALGAVNLAVPNLWNGIFLAAPDPGYAGYVSGVAGPFVHPSFYGQVMALGAVALLAHHQVTKRGHRLLLVGIALFALLSFRRKTWVSLPLGLLRTAHIKAPATAVVIAAVVAPAALLAAAPFLEPVVSRTVQTYVTNASVNARSAITLQAPDVANEYFPLGAGFGRYGSATAATHYSPEYFERGFDQIYGLNPNDPRFATDTFWPAVVGETGWLGLAVMVAGLWSLHRRFGRPQSSDSDTVRILRMTGSGWLVLLVVESVAAPVFFSPPTYPAVFLIAGLLAAMPGSRSADGDGATDLVPVRAVI